MNKLKSLISIQLKDSLGKYSSELNVKNNVLGKILQLLLLLVLAIPAVTFSIVTYNAFAELNQPELLITTMYISAVIMCLLLGIPFIMSQFFFSKDLKFLSSLPVSEDKLVFSKLATVYFYMLALTSVFLLPAMVVYAVNVGISIYYLVFALLIVLIAPILPIMIAALLVLLISPFIKGRRKKIFTIASNLILLIAIIGVQLEATKYSENPEIISRMLNRENGLIGFIGMKFPPSIWMTKMLMGSLIDGVLFIGINILFIILLKYLAGKFYRKALFSSGEEYAISSGKIKYIKHNKGWQLLKRNIFIIINEPVFLLNTILTIIIPIIMYIILAFTGEISSELLNNLEVKKYMLLIFTGILSLPAIVSSISATAITREGKAFWQTKILPLSASDNMRYRILTTIILELLGIIIVLIFSVFILPITVKIIILGTFFAIALSLFLAVVDFIINIYRPLLNWTNPTAAVKNNMNVMYSLGIRVIIASIIYIVYRIKPNILVNHDITIGIATLVFFLLFLMARYILYNRYAKKFNDISF